MGGFSAFRYKAPQTGRGRRGTKKLAAGVVLALVLAGMLIDRLPLRTPSPQPGATSGPVAAPAGWEVYFSPDGGCTRALLEALGAARSSIRVQAYSFTSAPIAKALLEAKRRGVDVQIVLDRGQGGGSRYSSADFLARAGVPVFLDGAHAIAHNKVMVIDGDTVVTGSFNFTKAAESRNAENLLIIRGAAELARRYTANWEHHLQHSEPYGKK